MPDVPPVSTTDAPDASTEARILDAAHRVFVRRGAAGARTHEIAAEAGVNKALLHYYFRTKEALADAIFLRAAGGLFPRMLAVLSSLLPLEEKLQRAVEIEMNTLEANPFLPGYLLAELQYHPERLTGLLRAHLPVKELRAQFAATLAPQVAAEVAAGRLRAGTTPDRLVVALFSLLVFPHAAAPMLDTMLGIDAARRDDLAAWRRDDLAAFLLRGFAP